MIHIHIWDRTGNIVTQLDLELVYFPHGYFKLSISGILAVMVIWKSWSSTLWKSFLSRWQNKKQIKQKTKNVCVCVCARMNDLNEPMGYKTHHKTYQEYITLLYSSPSQLNYRPYRMRPALRYNCIICKRTCLWTDRGALQLERSQRDWCVL